MDLSKEQTSGKEAVDRCEKKIFRLSTPLWGILWRKLDESSGQFELCWYLQAIYKTVINIRTLVRVNGQPRFDNFFFSLGRLMYFFLLRIVRITAVQYYQITFNLAVVTRRRKERTTRRR